MAKKKIRLTHSSSHPKAKGNVGDVISCDAEIADRFIAGNGAEEIVDKPKPKPEPKPENESEDGGDGDDASGDAPKGTQPGNQKGK